MAADIKIAGRFKLGSKVGSGSFGEVYRATDLERGEEVAIKLEPVNAVHPQLIYEAKIMKHISGGGIPAVYWYGTEGEFNAMAMELLGPSLEDLLGYCGKKFSLKTIIMVGDQLISRIEYVHSKHFIHRDIKPDNFLVGLGSKTSVVYLIDFGLVKRYQDPKTLQHIPYRNNKSLTGTARYASVNTHMGVEQSRRDDLECICYVLLYLLKGSLPWQGLTAKTKADKYKKIMESKMSMSAETLCKGFPAEFQTMIKYCKSLKFEEEPNYQIMKNCLKEMFEREKYEYDLKFDWESHAAALERKSTFRHLTQHQLTYRKTREESKEPESKKELGPRRNSWLNPRTPKHDQSSVAVYVSTCYQPDGSPMKRDSSLQQRGEQSRKNSGATDSQQVVVATKKKWCCTIV